MKADAPKDVRGRLIGIRGRLFLAFGAVAVMTIAAAAISLLVFTELSGSLARITHEDIPALADASELAERGGLITAIAPSLISARTELERARTWEGLKVQMSKMRRLAERIGARPGLGVSGQQMQGLLMQVEENLVDLDERVRRGFWFSKTNAELTEALRWAHADFLDEVEPLIEDARFNIETALENLRAGGVFSRTNVPRSVLESETEKREFLMRINASGNLAVGLIARAASISDEKSLNDTFIFLNDVIANLSDIMPELKNVSGGLSVRQATEGIIGYAKGENSLFDLRRDQLSNLGNAQRLVTVNRDLVEELKDVISNYVSEVNAETTSASAQAGKAIESGRSLLLGVTLMSFIVAVLVVWLYVGRNLLRRISLLGGSMRQIAAGNLEAHVTTDGDDEITDMATALKVFRDTAAETQNELVQAGKLAALGQMSAGIAHELNQPLAGIRSYAHNAKLLLGRRESKEAVKTIDKISNLTERMAKMTKHLKTLARRPSGTIDLVSLRVCIDNALSLLEGRIKREGVDLGFESGAIAGVDVVGGEIRLEQVFINILTNALDAMEGRSRPCLVIWADVEEDFVRLNFADNGCGLPQGDAAQIFDPFFTTKDVGEGLGLGLSISFNIVKDFGGSMKAETRPDGGTVVSVILSRGRLMS